MITLETMNFAYTKILILNPLWSNSPLFLPQQKLPRSFYEETGMT